MLWPLSSGSPPSYETRAARSSAATLVTLDTSYPDSHSSVGTPPAKVPRCRARLAVVKIAALTGRHRCGIEVHVSYPEACRPTTRWFGGRISLERVDHVIPSGCRLLMTGRTQMWTVGEWAPAETWPRATQRAARSGCRSPITLLCPDHRPTHSRGSTATPSSRACGSRARRRLCAQRRLCPAVPRRLLGGNRSSDARSGLLRPTSWVVPWSRCRPNPASCLDSTGWSARR